MSVVVDLPVHPVLKDLLSGTRTNQVSLLTKLVVAKNFLLITTESYLVQIPRTKVISWGEGLKDKWRSECKCIGCSGSFRKLKHLYLNNTDGLLSSLFLQKMEK